MVLNCSLVANAIIVAAAAVVHIAPIAMQNAIVARVKLCFLLAQNIIIFINLITHISPILSLR